MPDSLPSTAKSSGARALTAREAAGWLGVTPEALRRAAGAGRVAGAERDDAGRWRFDRERLELLGRAGRRAGLSAATKAIAGRAA